MIVFIDGEFWHSFNWEVKKPTIKSNRYYWIPKIEKNIQRDLINNVYYTSNEWQVLRLWEKQVVKNLEYCLKEIIEILEAEKSNL